MATIGSFKTLAIDGNAETGWAVNGHVKAADHKAVLVLAEPLAVEPAALLTIRLLHESPYGQHNIGRFRLSISGADEPSLSESGLPAEVVEALRADPTGRSAAQTQTLEKYYRGIAPRLAPTRQQVAELEKRRDALVKAFPLTLVSTAVAPRTVRILPRGNWLDDSGEVVEPGMPESPGLASGPLFLVCTNGRRDACCARYGVPLDQAMQQSAAGAVWECSHVGGHRFATNVYQMPDGLLYGRLRPQDASSLAAAVQEKRILLDHLRGRSAYAPALQAAEYYYRLQTGQSALNAFHLESAEQVEPGRWEILLRYTQDNALHRLQIAVEKTETLIYESCSLEKQTRKRR